jgi:dihydroxyacetone kinase-like protein
MMMVETEVPFAKSIGDLIDVLARLLLASEADFNALDRAIGDGDHGSNLARAARGLIEQRDALAAMPPADALVAAGRAIVMSVGGASGPLYGTLLMEMGKALPADPTGAHWAAAFSAGVAGVARRGRSDEGDKTMLDVLAPAAEVFGQFAKADLPLALEAMRTAAEEGFAAQRGLRASRGRAAYVGERSIGADDPGAASALRCLSATVDFLGEGGR